MLGSHRPPYSLLPTRNILWLMHKHASAYQWMTFLPIFASYYVPKLIVSRACRGDFRSCMAVFQGIAAFWKMLFDPGISVLPASLKATTLPMASRESARTSRIAPVTLDAIAILCKKQSTVTA